MKTKITANFAKALTVQCAAALLKCVALTKLAKCKHGNN